MSLTAAGIWQESQRFITLAEEHLNPRRRRPNYVVADHDEEEWLRISFLFPTLPEKSRTDLLVVRRFFLIAREQQERERTDSHETAEYSEAMADQVAADLKEEVASFSDVQREIWKNHYLLRGA